MSEVDLLVGEINRLGFVPDRTHQAHSYASLPLCVIDSVYSIGVKYTGVARTVQRFANKMDWMLSGRNRYSSSKGEHTLKEFLDAYHDLDEQLAADFLFANRQRTSSKSGILKSEACRRFAEALVEVGINDFPLPNSDTLLMAEAKVMAIPGQGSGISFDYFRLLAGDDEMVKPDRLVIRFVERVLGDGNKPVSTRQASALVKLAAKNLKHTNQNWTPARLDFHIWNYERRTGREAT